MMSIFGFLLIVGTIAHPLLDDSAFTTPCPGQAVAEMNDKLSRLAHYTQNKKLTVTYNY